jgi:nucleoside-diphosphate-sugar epimerase
MVIRDNNILLTGANGFLGQAILSLMEDYSLAVRATDLGETSGAFNVEYRKADITRLEELRPVFENINTVIHTAGLTHITSPGSTSGEKFRLINEIGTANVASAASAAGVGHLIVISSVSVYGPYTQGAYDEKITCNPIGSYALSKYDAELRAIETAQKTGMALTIFRLATLYGENDPGNVFRLIKSLDKGRFIWIGDGSNRKSLLYKGDAARACMAAAASTASGINIYNVSAPACTMREVVDGIADALGKYPLPVRFPASWALFLSRHLSRIPNYHISELHQTVKKWLAEDVYDTFRFQEDYGFQTKTSLAVGLKREVDWYRQNNQNGQVAK